MRFDAGRADGHGARRAIRRRRRHAAPVGPRRARPGARRRCVDERATIEGNAIDILLDGEKITADGSVKTEMRAGGRRSGPARERPGGRRRRRRRVPAMLQADKPVYARPPTTSTTTARASPRHLHGRRRSCGRADVDQGRHDRRRRTRRATCRRTGASSRGCSLEQVERQDEGARSRSTIGRDARQDWCTRTRRAARPTRGDAHLDGPQGDLAGDEIARLPAGRRRRDGAAGGVRGGGAADDRRPPGGGQSPDLPWPRPSSTT